MTDATPPADNTPPADTGTPATPGQPAAAAPASTPASQPPDASPKPTPESSPSSKDTTSTQTKDESPAPVEPAKPGDWKLPDEWKDKPWASKIKSEADLYKQLDHLNTAVGKKMVVPDLEKATDAEREEYFKQTRPTDGTAYQWGDKPIDPIVKDGMTESLMKNGVSAYQANNIIKDYQAAEGKLLAEAYNPDVMKQTMEAAFGKEWETVAGQTKQLLTGMMSAEDNALVDNLPNTYIALVYRALGNTVQAVNKVLQQYGVKESAAHVLAGSGTPPGQTDVNAIRAAKRAELSKLSSRPHTAQEKQKLITEINDTYKNDPRIVRKA
jgi:hypothetical protein